MNLRLRTPALARLTAVIGAAIGAMPAQQQESTARPLPDLSAAAFRVPVHTADPDPVGGEYGLWASGATYKVEFDGGITFHPALGRDHAWPWSWRTTAIERGGSPMAAESAATHTSEWRVEYRRGGVTEAYDVRQDGVEQTFVFASKPEGGGDLLIRGEVGTRLEASPCRGRPGAVVFCDDLGRRVVEYGAATVFDALGNTLAIETAFDGHELTLRVPGSWLDAAVAPITVDPLVKNITLWTSSGYTIDVDMARDDESNELMISYARWIGDDTDSHVILVDDDFTNVTLVYADLTASWKSNDPKVGFVGGADAWVITLTREFSSTSSAIRFRTHAKGLRAYATDIKALVQPNGWDTFSSDVGGTAAFSSGTKALVTFECDDLPAWSGTANTEVYGVLIDASTATAGVPFHLDPLGGSTANGRDLDREEPTVVPESAGGTDSWVVAWQEFNNGIANDDWDVIVARVDATGTPAGTRSVANGGSGTHSIRPRVAGRGGRFLLAFGSLNNFGKYGGAGGSNLSVQRFDWSGSASFPSLQSPKIVRDIQSLTYFTGNLTYDHETRSHWVLVSHAMSPNQIVFADLIGHRGGVVEAVTVSPVIANTDFSPAVAFNDDTDRFQIAYGSVNKAIYVDELVRFDAKTSKYGAGCGNGLMQSTGVPYRGSEFFTVRLGNLPQGTAAFLNLSLGPTTIALDGIGMPSCFMLTNPSFAIATLGTVVNAASADIQLPMPAPVVGDVYAQWVYLAPGANALGLETSEGLKIEIR